jgi:hypothetical protein
MSKKIKNKKAAEEEEEEDRCNSTTSIDIQNTMSCKINIMTHMDRVFL